MGSNQPAGTFENAAERRQQSWDKRCEGRSFREIGTELGISHEQVRRDVQHVLRCMTKLEQTNADEYRVAELAKLDNVEGNVLRHAITGNTGSILAWLKLSERRAALLGYVAVQRIELGGHVTIEVSALSDDDLDAIARGEAIAASASYRGDRAPAQAAPIRLAERTG